MFSRPCGFHAVLQPLKLRPTRQLSAVQLLRRNRTLALKLLFPFPNAVLTKSMSTPYYPVFTLRYMYYLHPASCISFIILLSGNVYY